MEDTKNMTLGKRILYYRKRMGLTQDQLAERMGVSAQAVSKWEHDLSCPDVTSLPRLAEIFGITTDELLGITSAQSQSAKEGIIDEDEDGQAEEAEPRWVTLERFTKRYLWALFLIALGGTYLVTEVLEMNVGFWSICWPMALLFFGLNMFNYALLVGCGCALGGAYVLLVNLGIIESIITWPLIVGICLVLCGLSLIFTRFRKPKTRGHQHSFGTGHTSSHKSAAGSERPTRVYTSTGGYIQADYAFCSDRITVSEEEFQGGDVDVAFGSLVVDLQGCTKVAPGCTLKMDLAFGSLVIITPRQFRIDTELDRAGASCDVSGSPDPDATPILLRGDCAFSSMKIQYV